MTGLRPGIFWIRRGLGLSPFAFFAFGFWAWVFGLGMIDLLGSVKLIFACLRRVGSSDQLRSELGRMEESGFFGSQKKRLTVSSCLSAIATCTPRSNAGPHAQAAVISSGALKH